MLDNATWLDPPQFRALDGKSAGRVCPTLDTLIHGMVVKVVHDPSHLSMTSTFSLLVTSGRAVKVSQNNTLTISGS
jgi:hypothetical protein